MRPMRRSLILAVAIVLAALFVSSAAATVRVTKRPGRVWPGNTASVTVVVKPKARCTIGVYYSTSTSEARGLGAKTATTITWTIGSNTKPGTWPVKIDCGKSGKAVTSVTVRQGAPPSNCCGHHYSGLSTRSFGSVTVTFTNGQTGVEDLAVHRLSSVTRLQ